jgi:hypothetical protein
VPPQPLLRGGIGWRCGPPVTRAPAAFDARPADPTTLSVGGFSADPTRGAALSGDAEVAGLALDVAAGAAATVVSTRAESADERLPGAHAAARTAPNAAAPPRHEI